MNRLEAFLLAKSENTKRRYNTVITDFEKFTGGSIITATQADAMDYHDSLHQRPGIKPRDEGAITLSGRTIRNQLEILKSVCDYFVKRKIMRENPFLLVDLWIPPKEYNEKRPTQIADFDRVMDFCNAPDRHTKKGIRDRAILACLWGGGCRKSEIINLKCKDVRIFNAGTVSTLYLQIRKAKNNKSIDKTLPDWASERVSIYVQVRKSEGAELDEPLFVNYRTSKDISSGSIPASTFDEIFHKWRECAGLPRVITPHSARATVISKLLADEVPIRDVSKFIGHSSVTTTEVYDRGVFGVSEKVAKRVIFGLLQFFICNDLCHAVT